MSLISLTTIVGDAKSGRSEMAEAITAHFLTKYPNHQTAVINEGEEDAVVNVQAIKASKDPTRLILVGKAVDQVTTKVNLGDIPRYRVACSKI